MQTLIGCWGQVSVCVCTPKNKPHSCIINLSRRLKPDWRKKAPSMDYKRTTVVAMQKHDLFWIIRLQRTNWSERACLNGAQKQKTCKDWAIGHGESGCEKRAGGGGSSNAFASELSHGLRERETGRKNKKGQKEGGQLSFRALVVGETLFLGTFKAPLLPPPSYLASLTFHLQPCSGARSSQTRSQARCRQTLLELCSQPWWFWGMWPPW